MLKALPALVEKLNEYKQHFKNNVELNENIEVSCIDCISCSHYRFFVYFSDVVHLFNVDWLLHTAITNFTCRNK